MLTEKGIAEVRTGIRREKRERNDIYLPWVAAITGLIGAMTGLAAVYFK